jgi:uncharacterized OB-fold protein
MSDTPDRPLPQPTAETAAYWRAAARKELVIQKCIDCGKAQFYPRGFCVSCLSDEITWIPCSGRGRIYTYTINHIPGYPGKSDQLPYANAIVDLDEGVRMLTEIVKSDLDCLDIGALVQVCFEPISDSISLPQFRLVSED